MATQKQRDLASAIRGGKKNKIRKSGTTFGNPSAPAVGKGTIGSAIGGGGAAGGGG